MPPKYAAVATIRKIEWGSSITKKQTAIAKAEPSIMTTRIENTAKMIGKAPTATQTPFGTIGRNETSWLNHCCKPTTTFARRGPADRSVPRVQR